MDYYRNVWYRCDLIWLRLHLHHTCRFLPLVDVLFRVRSITIDSAKISPLPLLDYLFAPLWTAGAYSGYGYRTPALPLLYLPPLLLPPHLFVWPARLPLLPLLFRSCHTCCVCSLRSTRWFCCCHSDCGRFAVRYHCDFLWLPATVLIVVSPVDFVLQVLRCVTVGYHHAHLVCCTPFGCLPPTHSCF